MDRFVFRWKKSLFWKSKTVVGFTADPEADRIALHFEDGSMFEISQWSRCDCLLGADYFQVKKRRAEAEAGVAIPTKERASQ